MSFVGPARLRLLTARANALGIGPTTEFHYDESSERMVQKRSQDLDPHFDFTSEAQWDPDFDGYTPSRDMQHVAHVPNLLIEKWLFEEGLNIFDDNHWPAIRRKLNDSEFKKLRTGMGHIG